MTNQPMDPEMAQVLIENLLLPACWYLIALVGAVYLLFCGVVLSELVAFTSAKRRTRSGRGPSWGLDTDRGGVGGEPAAPDYQWEVARQPE